MRNKEDARINEILNEKYLHHLMRERNNMIKESKETS